MSLVALIREAECVGCTKCIQACPFDAILGSFRQMHTVLADECIGCKLCIAPCPVDCIDLVELLPTNPISNKEKAAHAKKRYQARHTRLKAAEAPIALPPTQDEKKAFIQAALQRAKVKK